MKIEEGTILVPNMNNMDNTKLRVLQVGMGRVLCETLDGEYVGNINDSNDYEDVLYYYDIAQ